MHNIWCLFMGDLKRLRSNVVAMVIALGLVLLPSLFSWYNVLACWDVFDNTGNIKVAVANTDEGIPKRFSSFKSSSRRRSCFFSSRK